MWPRLLSQYGPNFAVGQRSLMPDHMPIGSNNESNFRLDNSTSIPDDRYALSIYLRAFLDVLKGEEVLYYPTPGNGGDSVLNVGAYQAFKRAGLKYTPINLKADVTGKTVILGGGGNLVPLYQEMRHALLEGNILKRCGRLIILPSTIRGNEDLLQPFDERVTVFCRDPESYIHVLRHASTKNVYLDHDMAFHIDIKQFYEECKPYTDVPGLFERLVTKAGHTFSQDDTSTVRSFFRTDGEKLVKFDKEGNLDISIIFELGTWPENAYEATWCFFEAIKRSGLVLTDRLHVGIAASLLTKRCKFYDNSYGKNRTVYAHSIQKYVDFDAFEFVKPETAP
jgi:exopolysaccharide biosynthesis predicted pyruvyltransferase EpsI